MKHPDEAKIGEQVYLCGTRSVLRSVIGWHVVCATCHAVKRRCYSIAPAIAHATDTSARSCDKCGAR